MSEILAQCRLRTLGVGATVAVAGADADFRPPLARGFERRQNLKCTTTLQGSNSQGSLLILYLVNISVGLSS